MSLSVRQEQAHGAASEYPEKRPVTVGPGAGVRVGIGPESARAAFRVHRATEWNSEYSRMCSVRLAITSNCVPGPRLHHDSSQVEFRVSRPVPAYAVTPPAVVPQPEAASVHSAPMVTDRGGPPGTGRPARPGGPEVNLARANTPTGARYWH